MCVIPVKINIKNNITMDVTVSFMLSSDSESFATMLEQFADELESNSIQRRNYETLVNSTCLCYL